VGPTPEASDLLLHHLRPKTLRFRLENHPDSQIDQRFANEAGTVRHVSRPPSSKTTNGSETPLKTNFQALIKMGFLLSKHENVRFLFSCVERKFWDFSTGGRRLQKYWTKRFFVVNSLLLQHFTVACAYVILHLAFAEVPIPEGRTRWLPTLIAFPVNTDTSPVYEILYAILSWNLFISIFGNAFFDLLFVYAAQHLCAQFMLLKAMLKKVDFGLVEHHDDVVKFKSKTFQTDVYSRLVICINHHSLLLR
jgi:hypothetical protein